MTANGIPTQCVICDAPLRNPHELTGLCRECKLVARNERLGAVAQPADIIEGTGE